MLRQSLRLAPIVLVFFAISAWLDNCRESSCMPQLSFLETPVFRYGAGAILLLLFLLFVAVIVLAAVGTEVELEREAASRVGTEEAPAGNPGESAPPETATVSQSREPADEAR